jgi:hypothetical protein
LRRREATLKREQLARDLERADDQDDEKRQGAKEKDN